MRSKDVEARLLKAAERFGSAPFDAEKAQLCHLAALTISHLRVELQQAMETATRRKKQNEELRAELREYRRVPSV